jgi:hypothetical protein
MFHMRMFCERGMRALRLLALAGIYCGDPRTEAVRIMAVAIPNCSRLVVKFNPRARPG